MTRYAIAILLVACFAPDVPAADPAPASKDSAPAVRAPAPPAKVVTDDNAALRYWQAISQMPQLGEEEVGLLSHAMTISPTDEKARALLARTEGSLRLAVRASKMERCAWGLDMELDGPELLLPHLGKMRDLARYLALRSRVAFAAGNHDAAIEDAMAMLRMARHAGNDPIVISILVEYAIEGMAVELLAAESGALTKGRREALAVELTTAPPRHPVSAGIRGERMFVPWLRRTIKESPQRVNELLPAADLAMWAQLRLRGVEPMLKGVESAYDDLELLLNLPESEFEKANAQFNKKVEESKNPLVKLLLPAIAATKKSELRADAKMKMLRAAIAEAAGDDAGKAAAKEILGDLAIERKPFDGGVDFICSNRLGPDGKPIQLRVGKEKKAP